MTNAIQVAWTQHRGRVARSQQDALLVGQDIVQSPDWPITAGTLSRSGGRCAVADGVAISPVPHLASTLALLQWRDSRFSVVNVGDSRVYRIGRDGVWQRLSKDHTYRQAMIERGEIGPDQSIGQLYDDLEHLLIADEAEDGFAVHWQPGDWMPGDTFLLCTDGVHDTLGETHLMALYHAERLVTEQVSRYREAVLAAGAPDNFSLMVLRGEESR